ncbi:MAG: HEAT repeat domain-containing protein, partial [Planctomycetota bacterium]
TSSSGEDAFMWRALNANFRLGSDRQLRAVAKFAADPSASQSLRLEAMEMLATWQKPDALDRVVNLWRPIKPRPTAPVADVVADHLDDMLSAHISIANRATALAAALEISDIAPQLMNQVNDRSVDVATRSASLLALGRLDPNGIEGTAVALLSEDAPGLQVAAIQVLFDVNASNLLTVLRDAIDSPHSVVRQLAWDTLSRNDSAEATRLIEEGIRHYIDGQLNKDVWLNVLQAAKSRIHELGRHRGTARRREDGLGRGAARPAGDGDDESCGEQCDPSGRRPRRGPPVIGQRTPHGAPSPPAPPPDSPGHSGNARASGSARRSRSAANRGLAPVRRSNPVGSAR